jgi:hypothetical protein
LEGEGPWELDDAGDHQVCSHAHPWYTLDSV